ncbi:exonuclease domain-containing protein [Candidatus Pelagibacter communis]|uniref:exonuclease domain-containing protein n=1 Tax=Pelagibacter ubique TaxID=198252 RepID=UPI00065B3FBB|nr:exonuclease domain-containing protein [Candidatus Pelagibacter ubique]
MDKFVIYDTETTNSTIWGSIIEVGAVVVDKNLNEIGKLNIRGRMPEGEVPSAKALLVNSTSIDLLTKGNYSHYEFLGAVENFFSKAAPALFMGWSNLNFDRRMFHFNFFKGNRYPYITHSSPNKEHDGLHVARAAQTINSETLKTELTDAGNESLALEGLARQQGFDTSQQHTAYHDAFTSLKILRIIKEKHNDNWEKFLTTSTKSSVESILKTEGIYSIFENVKGRNMMYLVSTLHPEHCFHPTYASWGYLWDLRRDPEPFLNMSVNELKANLKKISPKALRVIKTNKAPVVLDKKFALKEKAYADLDLETIQKRAKLVRSSENLCKNIQIINREAAEEKSQTQNQEDLLPEETLYEKFVPNKDTALFKTWHSSSWEDKLRLLDKFQDKRCAWFGQKIIYQEAPHVLPPDLYKNIKSEIARRILSKNREKWQTIAMAYTEIDTLRDQASNRDDEEELKKLDEINEFIMSIEKKYEIA